MTQSRCDTVYYYYEWSLCCTLYADNKYSINYSILNMHIYIYIYIYYRYIIDILCINTLVLLKGTRIKKNKLKIEIMMHIDCVIRYC